MTPRQIIASHIRAVRTIPVGSILWLQVPTTEEFTSVEEVGASLDQWLRMVDSPEQIQVWLDTPNGDFEDSWIFSAKEILQPKLLTKVVSAKETLRSQLVKTNGKRAIATVESLVPLYTDYLLNMYRREFGYDGPSPKVRVNWKAKSSWGGRTGITISPGYLYQSKSFYSYLFHEYCHISDLPDIGSFYSLNRLDHVKALVAHELAHFCQRRSKNGEFYQERQNELPELDYQTAHGEGWQYLYRFLRQALNSRIGN